MTALDRMTRVYNNAMVRHRSRYYENSGFFNFGYWGGTAQTQSQASAALVDQLLDRIAVKGGRVLDVACGAGASTRRLMDSYAPDMIVGINISEVQLEAARALAPQCQFVRMDAARLEFADSEFDAVICVEAAFHFKTREAFLREALRVLRPGGSLVLSDILFRGMAGPLASLFHVPQANRRAGLADYGSLLKASGFDAVRVEDATDVCLRPFLRRLMAWPLAQRKAGASTLAKAIRRSIGYAAVAGYFAAVCENYVLASARKPDRGST